MLSWVVRTQSESIKHVYVAFTQSLLHFHSLLCIFVNVYQVFDVLKLFTVFICFSLFLCFFYFLICASYLPMFTHFTFWNMALQQLLVTSISKWNQTPYVPGIFDRYPIMHRVNCFTLCDMGLDVHLYPTLHPSLIPLSLIL